MTSILTNGAAISALQTLRSINSSLQAMQRMVSSGMRVGSASDNSAYWSISTTMRSDTVAMSAVVDALGLAEAKTDVAYSGLSSVLDVLSEFKARLVTAKEGSVDRAKIQEELEQLKAQTLSIAQASSFAGENWLSTDVEDIFDETNSASTVASFVRGPNSVAVTKTDIPLMDVALFNTSGGGILQRDPRDMKTIGGLRFSYGPEYPMSEHAAGNTNGAHPSDFQFTFSSPMTFDPGDSITFNVIVDADNPADGLPSPQNAGMTTAITIDRNVVNAALGRSDGVISNYKDYAVVLSSALSGSGTSAITYWRYEPPGQNVTRVDIPDIVGIWHRGLTGYDGSSMQIANVAANGVAVSGEISDQAVRYGPKSNSMTLAFEPFKVYDGVIVTASFYVNREQMQISFDSETVNTVLGIDTGEVATADDMVSLLTSLINRPEVVIANSGGNVSLSVDAALDRRSGHRSEIAFWDINVNIEPIPTLDFMNIDIEANPEMVDTYISYMEVVSERVTDGAATIGALQQRIELQTTFSEKLMDASNKGVGRLIDADMNEASTRLKALQTQQQLAVQSLQIANSEPQALLQLFN